MSTIELKELIVSRISQIDDETILNEIFSVINSKNEQVIILSKEQQTSIKKSQIEYSKGSFTTNESLIVEMELWLKE